MMSIFRRRGSIDISEKEPNYKVRYLGNVQTALMKGDGCVDKPLAVIWNNYLRNPNPGLEMKLTITSSGLKAETKEQGLTEYRAHRISYCVAHPQYPRLFVWVYRHEGKKMKMELRCHAVLCKNEANAKTMALVLHEKLKFALREFRREKTRKQNSRLVLQKTNSLPQSGSFLPKRTQMLSTGQNFKPSICKSNTAPRLGAILEDVECEGYESQSEQAEDYVTDADFIDGSQSRNIDLNSLRLDIDGLSERVIDLEIGNDIEELRKDKDVQFCIQNGDSDDESSESGFHEQDLKEGLPADDMNMDEMEEPVCDLPSGMVEEETLVTNL
ncbi:hypothetical protein CHS0354_023290 [Potamilus streckersoni]|uniref:PID domain-containing protein n=1 Tax=Potamilus streckersoni TaxID=2493646 RepID=A0AAE0W836_9BIVA|nr:hypothetical protein CHS0354_023290 [Potamilus streckersoni]